MDQGSQKIVDWLKGLPLNAIVEWSTTHGRKDFDHGYVDISVIDIESDCSMNWVWTVIAPDDPDGLEHPESLWQIPLSYDAEIHKVSDPHDWFIKEIGIPLGATLTNEQETELEKIKNEKPDRTRETLLGWSMKHINEALSEWAKTHANRPDIKFIFNPEVKGTMLKEIEAIDIKEINKSELHDMGDGVLATDQVMDVLLQDVDEGAKIMKKFKEHLGIKKLKQENQD